MYHIKLRMPDYHSIPVPCCNFCKKISSIFWLEVFLCCHKYVWIWVKSAESIAPLFCKCIWSSYKWFAVKSESLALHCYSNHFKCFAGTDLVGNESISIAVKAACNCIFLMGFKSYIWVHSNKVQVWTIIFSEPYGIEFFIIEIGKFFSSFRVCKNPILKFLFQLVLFRLNYHCFILIYS